MRFHKTILAAVILLSQTQYVFAQHTVKPLSLVFMIDVSASQERTLSRTRKTTRAFAASLLNSGNNKVAVVTFVRNAVVRQPLTDDLKQIDLALKDVRFEPPPGYVGGGVVVGDVTVTRKALAMSGTAIWDAVLLTCERTFVQPPEEQRRALIIITDGLDTNSQRKRKDVIARATELKVKVYVLGVGNKEDVKHNEGALRDLAEQTGGQAFFPKSEEDMNVALAKIEQRLRFP
jgi:VWFA-related protein